MGFAKPRAARYRSLSVLWIRCKPRLARLLALVPACALVVSCHWLWTYGASGGADATPPDLARPTETDADVPSTQDVRIGGAQDSEGLSSDSIEPLHDLGRLRPTIASVAGTTCPNGQLIAGGGSCAGSFFVGSAPGGSQQVWSNACDSTDATQQVALCLVGLSVRVDRRAFASTTFVSHFCDQDERIAGGFCWCPVGGALVQAGVDGPRGWSCSCTQSGTISVSINCLPESIAAGINLTSVAQSAQDGNAVAHCAGQVTLGGSCIASSGLVEILPSSSSWRCVAVAPLSVLATAICADGR